jgi:hypothetical protein
VFDPAVVVGAIVVVAGLILAFPEGGKPIVPPRRLGAAVVEVEVLAEEAGPVTGVVKTGGEVVSLVAVVLVGLPAPVRVTSVPVRPYTRVVSVLAPQDGGPGGAAQPIGDESVVEAHPLVLE